MKATDMKFKFYFCGVDNMLAAMLVMLELSANDEREGA